MIAPEQLQSIGLSPKAAERALQSLQGCDLRGFVHELLLHGLWGDVVDEAQPHPQWMERWQQLAATGFPVIDAAALQRLLDAGVDVHDLTGVVRSAQILAIYNIAQLLDYPALGLGWDLPKAATPHLACASEAAPDCRPAPTRPGPRAAVARPRRPLWRTAPAGPAPMAGTARRAARAHPRAGAGRQPPRPGRRAVEAARGRRTARLPGCSGRAEGRPAGNSVKKGSSARPASASSYQEKSN